MGPAPVELAPARKRPSSPLARRYRVAGGKIRADRLELGIAEHCNLACRSCSHLSPVLPKLYLDAPSVQRDLEILTRSYHTKSVRLIGGEPLLHPGIVELIAVIRRSGVGDSVCVVTNGVLLPRMEADFWQSVDRVEVSLYPGKELSAAQQLECRERAKAGAATIAFHHYDDFRESYSETGTSNAELARAIYDSCLIVHSWRCHTVAQGRFFKCPQSYYLPQALDPCAGNDLEDSLAIEDSERFGADLLAYLESPEPLRSCGHCLGTAGRRFSHAQVSRSGFRSLQQGSAEELVDRDLLDARPPRLPYVRGKFAALRSRARKTPSDPGRP